MALWRTLTLPHIGLRTRLTLGVMLIALVNTLGVAAIAFVYVKANTLDVISSDQMQRTVAVADTIDQKFISRRVLLKTFAGSLEAQQLRGTAQIQPFCCSTLALYGFAIKNPAPRGGVFAASHHSLLRSLYPKNAASGGEYDPQRFKSPSGL